MKKKGIQESDRLTAQQKENGGAECIFGESAQVHEQAVHSVSEIVLRRLQQKYPKLSFRYRNSIPKKEINEYLQKIDSSLGQTLFVSNANIRPDGGIIEVQDDHGRWRIVVVSEAKFQGKDIDNIKAGVFVGKKNNQVLMVAGNAIERAHKNIREIANFMLMEQHFPYILFLEGSNFLTQDVNIERPDGSIYTLTYDNGALNRLDRLTASNYGMPINANLCENKYIANKSNSIMLQAVSIYTKGNGERWEDEDMIKIVLDIANTSIRVLSRDLFDQLTKD